MLVEVVGEVDGVVTEMGSVQILMKIHVEVVGHIQILFPEMVDHRNRYIKELGEKRHSETAEEEVGVEGPLMSVQKRGKKVGVVGVEEKKSMDSALEEEEDLEAEGI